MREQLGPLPGEVAKLAYRQHGVVSRAQLLALGLSSSGIDRRISSGQLHGLHRGVYAVGHRLLTQEGRWLAAVLACGDGTVLSYGPAGQLGGFVSRRERFALHVTSPSRSLRTQQGIVGHTSRNLKPRDTTKRLAIPVTTPTRTVWDLASIWTPLATGRAFARAERAGLSRARMAELLAASPSRCGAGVIRELLEDAPLPLSETRSWLEDLLLFICREHSLPIPAISVPLLGYEADFLWPDARFVVEADGSDHLDPGQRDSDNERDLVFGRAGFLVRRYTSRAMGRGREVTAEILAILAERLPMH